MQVSSSREARVKFGDVKIMLRANHHAINQLRNVHNTATAVLWVRYTENVNDD